MQTAASQNVLIFLFGLVNLLASGVNVDWSTSFSVLMPKWHQEKLFPTHSSSWLVLSPVPSANSINFKAHHCELGVKATMLLRKSKVLQAALLIRDPWRPKVCKVPQPFIVREGLLGLTEMAPSHPSSKRSLSVNY